MEIIDRRNAKEIITVRVDPGECLLGKIESAMKEVGGNAIVISAVGSLSKVVLTNPQSLDKENRRTTKRELEGPFEIVSLIGDVGPKHARKNQMSHIHIAVGSHDKVEGGGLSYGSEAWYPIRVYLLANG